MRGRWKYKNGAARTNMITETTLRVVSNPNRPKSFSRPIGKMSPDTPEPAQVIPNASPLRFTNHSSIYKMDGLYAIQPPIPKPTP